MVFHYSSLRRLRRGINLREEVMKNPVNRATACCQPWSARESLTSDSGSAGPREASRLRPNGLLRAAALPAC